MKLKTTQTPTTEILRMNDKTKKPAKRKRRFLSLEKSRELYGAVSDALEMLYPNHACALEYGGEPWRLVVMARLSAQCTDARVNIVCRELFAKYPTAKDLAYADITDVENIIKPCGLYRMKASDIVGECRDITERFGGTVPADIELLLSMPGVGRKIANLIMGDIHGMGGVVCDTHFMRICGRLGFYPEELRDPSKIELLMDPVIPKDEQSAFCHRIVQFGRDVCSARGEMCEDCPINNVCRKGTKKGKTN